jgi:hypothetical protein
MTEFSEQVDALLVEQRKTNKLLAELIAETKVVSAESRALVVALTKIDRLNRAAFRV